MSHKTWNKHHSYVAPHTVHAHPSASHHHGWGPIAHHHSNYNNYGGVGGFGGLYDRYNRYGHGLGAVSNYHLGDHRYGRGYGSHHPYYPHHPHRYGNDHSYYRYPYHKKY